MIPRAYGIRRTTWFQLRRWCRELRDRGACAENGLSDECLVAIAAVVHAGRIRRRPLRPSPRGFRVRRRRWQT